MRRTVFLVCSAARFNAWLLASAFEVDVEMICPRCGTSRPPVGPRLSLDGWGRACARFACHGCGHSWTEAVPEQDCAAGVACLPVRLQPRGSVPEAAPDRNIPLALSKYRAAG
jgi:rubredoxin